MIKSNGGIIGPDNVTTGGAFGTASGVFKLGEVTNLIKDSKWPTAGPQGYDVANSCRFNRGSSDHLTFTPSSTGNRRTFTISFWIKIDIFSSGEYGIFDAGGDANSNGWFDIQQGHTAPGDFMSQFYNGAFRNFKLTQKIQDTSAWYHFVVAVDTTQGTDTNRLKYYINGTQVTDFNSPVYPNQNFDLNVNTSGQKQTIGGRANGSSTIVDFFNGYLSEFVMIDGQQLAPTDFGEFNSQTGIWVPKVVTGLTFGTNGFYLPFTNASALGEDFSGEDNDFSVNNLTSIDQSTDTCTTNFATWNPLFRRGTITPTFSDGNLTSDFTGGAQQFALTTFGASSGKWYAEMKWVSAHGNGATATGILDMAYTGTADPNNAVTNAFGYFGSGTKNVSGSASSYGASYGAGDIIGIALNCDDNQVTFYKNGASQGVISIIAGVTYGIFGSEYDGRVASLNTGSPSFAISSGNTDGNGFGNFEYAVPSGYLSINTKNLAAVLA